MKCRPCVFLRCTILSNECPCLLSETRVSAVQGGGTDYTPFKHSLKSPLYTLSPGCSQRMKSHLCGSSKRTIALKLFAGEHAWVAFTLHALLSPCVQLLTCNQASGALKRGAKVRSVPAPQASAAQRAPPNTGVAAPPCPGRVSFLQM